jgi:hypothetical protein
MNTVESIRRVKKLWRVRAERLVGQRRHRLTVIGVADTNPLRVRVRCACGTEKVVMWKALNAKVRPTTSCGCVGGSRERYSRRHQHLMGQRYGMLVVVRDLRVPCRRRGWDLYEHECLCMCDCGQRTQVEASQLRRPSGTRSCGCLQRRQGPEHPNWDQTKTEAEREDEVRRRKCYKYKAWRRAVVKAHPSCVCGATRGLQAHHLEGWNERPDLRYAVDNGVTLGEACHVAYHRAMGWAGSTKYKFLSFMRGH